MPIAADELFAEFLAALTPSPRELGAARTAAAEIAAVLRTRLRPDSPVIAREDHLVAGSFGKRTAIRPLPPVDLYYLLPEDVCVGGPPSCGAALRAVAAALDGALGLRAVPDGLRVALGGAEPAVVVVPAVAHGGAFLIPGQRGWQVSNPAAESAALRMAEAASGGRVGPLLALAKAWRRTGAVPLTAFALEVLACQFAAGGPAPSPLPALFADFLAWIRGRTPDRLQLPGGMGHLDIDASWHGQAEAGYWRCVLAARQAAAGELDLAAAEWARLLGPLFPTATERGETP